MKDGTPPTHLYASPNSKSPVGWAYSDVPLDDEFVTYVLIPAHIEPGDAVGLLQQMDQCVDCKAWYIDHDGFGNCGCVEAKRIDDDQKATIATLTAERDGQHESILELQEEVTELEGRLQVATADLAAANERADAHSQAVANICEDDAAIRNICRDHTDVDTPGLVEIVGAVVALLVAANERAGKAMADHNDLYEKGMRLEEDLNKQLTTAQRELAEIRRKLPAWIRRWWRFDHQQPSSSWHDREDFIAELDKRLGGKPSLLEAAESASGEGE